MEKATGSSPVAPTIFMIKKETLEQLYCSRKLSMVDVANALCITPATVRYWMARHKLIRRSRSESVYVKLNPNGDPFKIKENLTNKDRDLLLIGLMLYWAEGSRRNPHVVQLANLDSRLLSIFVKFLKIICGVRQDKICLTVQLFRTFDKEKAKLFWSKELSILPEKIRINTHSDKRSKIDELRSFNGIARLEVRNVKLKKWIDVSLNNIIKSWN